MGKEIVYCVGCGDRLIENDFVQGRAQNVESRPYCVRCKPLTAPPAPPARERGTERRPQSSTKLRRPATEMFLRAAPPPPPPPKKSNAGWVVGGLVLAAAAVAIGSATLSGGKGAPPAEAPVRTASTPASAPRGDLEARFRELEALAAATSDPQAVIVRCDQLRPTFRGTAYESRLTQIEFKAVEQLKERERAVDLDRALAAIRKIVTEDPEGVRRVEVESMFLSTMKKAGSREAEIRKERDDYRTRCDEAEKRREAQKKTPAPPPAPARSWAECFQLANQKVQANDYPNAKALFLEGLPTLPETKPEDLPTRYLYAAGLYNLACIYFVEASKLPEAARKEALDAAFKHLDRALGGDFGRFQCPCHKQTGGFGHMAEDKDLESARADARFAALVKKYTQ